MLSIFKKLFNFDGRLDRREFSIYFFAILLPLSILPIFIFLVSKFGSVTYRVLFEYLLSLFPFKSELHSYHLYDLLMNLNGGVYSSESVMPESYILSSFTFLACIIALSIFVQRLRSIFNEFHFILLLLIFTFYQLDFLYPVFIIFLLTAKPNLVNEESSIGRFLNVNMKNINFVIVLAFTFSIFWNLPFVQIKLNSISNKLSESSIIEKTRLQENRDLKNKLVSLDIEKRTLLKKIELKDERIKKLIKTQDKNKEELKDAYVKNAKLISDVQRLKKLLSDSGAAKTTLEYEAIIRKKDSLIKELDDEITKQDKELERLGK